jgi:hypothetical protein
MDEAFRPFDNWDNQSGWGFAYLGLLPVLLDRETTQGTPAT